MIRITERGYEKLKVLALVAMLLPFGYLAYESFVPSRGPGDIEAVAGDRAFQDRRYERALSEYQAALEVAPDHGHALLGKANTLVELGRFDEAIAAYDRYIRDVDGDFAGVYANRGIAYDRMGEHELALRDYRSALAMDSSVDDGPGWLTQFLYIDTHNQSTIGDRADYLAVQLSLPEEERVLSVPEVDGEQRAYTQRLD